MCYYLINILKIVMSAERSVIIHQTSAFVILLAETSLYYFVFCCWRCKVWYCPPVQGTLATLLILTLWFMKGV